MKTKRLFVVSTGKVDLERLARCGPQELQKIYRKLFGHNAPAGSSQYARRKIAWQVQADREGGLPESARQHALVIAQDARLRVRITANLHRRSVGAALDHSVTTHVVSDHDSRLPMPGSVLVKKYKDQNIIVKVLTVGFEYDGRRFDSLSAIAKEITGTKWNGFLFFGLVKEARHAS